uniref:Uncharacterized protein n=1 Tax=Oryza brachyantha TaxID=4533 RepID=J3N0N7_ORYBR
MQRKPRKKERKRQKKDAQFGETADPHSKHGHKKRKHESSGIVRQERRKEYKVTVEHLEKSSLSEEHEAPSCFFLRVKLAPTNQRRGQEATAGMSVTPRVTGQLRAKEIGMDVSMTNRKREFQPHVKMVLVLKQVVTQ